MTRKLKLLCLAVIFAFVTLGEGLAATEMGIITGSEKGTYYQFGLNLQQLVAQQGIDLSVYTSNGSIENIHAVYKRPRTQLGIVQSDVLAFVARVQSNPTLREVANKIRMVFPLYNEEIHLVARKGIKDFDDLANRRVAIGEDGSGTYLTARLLFEISKVKPQEMVTIGTSEALEQLKAGKVDAMFYVAGYPVKLFSEGITAEDGLDLIPITNADVIEFYPKSEVPAGTYTWKPETVPTATVKAVMISYDFKGENCGHVGNLAAILYQNLSWLEEKGHPKWKSVDLNYDLKGWEQYRCVTTALQRVKKDSPAKPRQTEINPVLDAIKEILQ